MRVDSEQQSQIVDISAEKIYELDTKKKTYTVMTFEEMKHRLPEGMASAQKAAPRQEGENRPEVSAKTDIKVTETGNTETTRGYPCTQYLMEVDL